MKIRFIHWANVMVVSALAAGLMVMAGCEGDTDSDSSGVDEYFDANPYSSDPREDPSEADLIIAPAAVAISIVGAEVVFTARGGDGKYRWYLANDNGDLYSHGANQAIYVCRKVGNNTVSVHDNSAHYATAKVTPETDTMTISPSSFTLSGGTLETSFYVGGGTPPYVWTTANVSLGTVSYASSTSEECAYTAVSGAYGQNTVVVRDAEGRTTSATVTQSQ